MNWRASGTTRILQGETALGLGALEGPWPCYLLAWWCGDPEQHMNRLLLFQAIVCL